MRPQQALGRPGTPVIPPGYQQAHGQVVAKTMQSCVSLRHPAGTTKTWNAEDQKTDYTAAVPYETDVPARIQPQTSRATDRQTEQAAETLVVAGYLITLPMCADGADQTQVGDLVTVIRSSDAQLIGRTLRVSDIPRSSLRFERDLFCTLTDPAETT